LEQVLPCGSSDIQLQQQKAILEYTTSASTRACKWSVRRFEQMSFLLLYSMHIEITELEAQILAAESAMPQCSRERLQILLRDYSDVMRNIDYLTGFSSAGHDAAAWQSRPVIPGMQIQTRDHFDYVSFPASAPGLDQVRSVLKRILPAKHAPNQRYSPARIGKVGLTVSHTEVSRLVNRLAWIIVAITGGVFLLVPMIIMTFATDAHMRLVVVSVAVLWFAVSVALVSKATNQELIAATAAYSAVLLVYVGTTSGASGH